MALSDEDKKEMHELFAGAFVEGIKRFRSEAEEEAAKANAGTDESKKGGAGDSGNGSGKRDFSLSGFILGER
jgi:hypothetical protein